MVGTVCIFQAQVRMKPQQLDLRQFDHEKLSSVSLGGSSECAFYAVQNRGVPALERDGLIAQSKRNRFVDAHRNSEVAGPGDWRRRTRTVAGNPVLPSAAACHHIEVFNRPIQKTAFDISVAGKREWRCRPVYSNLRSASPDKQQPRAVNDAKGPVDSGKYREWSVDRDTRHADPPVERIERRLRWRHHHLDGFAAAILPWHSPIAGRAQDLHRNQTRLGSFRPCSSAQAIASS